MRRLISPNHLLGAAAKLGYKRPAVGGSEDRAGGLSVNGFFSKVARLAVSKAAAFGYAVAVGVTGNMAFNYVQPHAPLATAAAVATRPAPEGGATDWANPATTAPAATRPHAVPAATHAERPPAAPPHPAARHQAVASAPVLPEPPAAVALPGLDALPPPPLKPAALPSEAALRPAPAPAPDPVRPPVQVPAVSAAVDSPPAAPAPAAPATGTLLPLGPAIEVEAPPTPPRVDAPARPAPPVRAAVAAAAAAKEPPPRKPSSGFAISDLWHPGRAVGKGLHWAGRQVPVIGDADPPPREAVAAPSAPTPLLPAANDAVASGHRDIAPPPRKPGAPGPGSGGLY